MKVKDITELTDALCSQNLLEDKESKYKHLSYCIWEGWVVCFKSLFDHIINNTLQYPTSFIYIADILSLVLVLTAT